MTLSGSSLLQLHLPVCDGIVYVFFTAVAPYKLFYDLRNNSYRTSFLLLWLCDHIISANGRGHDTNTYNRRLYQHLEKMWKIKFLSLTFSTYSIAVAIKVLVYECRKWTIDGNRWQYWWWTVKNSKLKDNNNVTVKPLYNDHLMGYFGIFLRFLELI